MNPVTNFWTSLFHAAPRWVAVDNSYEGMAEPLYEGVGEYLFRNFHPGWTHAIN